MKMSAVSLGFEFLGVGVGNIASLELTVEEKEIEKNIELQTRFGKINVQGAELKSIQRQFSKMSARLYGLQRKEGTIRNDPLSAVANNNTPR